MTSDGVLDQSSPVVPAMMCADLDTTFFQIIGGSLGFVIWPVHEQSYDLHQNRLLQTLGSSWEGNLVLLTGMTGKWPPNDRVVMSSRQRCGVDDRKRGVPMC